MTMDERKSLIVEMETAYKKQKDSATNRRAKMGAALRVVEKRYKLYDKEIQF